MMTKLSAVTPQQYTLKSTILYTYSFTLHFPVCLAQQRLKYAPSGTLVTPDLAPNLVGKHVTKVALGIVSNHE